MLKKILIFGVYLLIVSAIGGHSLEQSNNVSVKKPTFKCKDMGANTCVFTNVILSDEEPEWDPVPPASKLWKSVQFKNSSIPVFTNDICRVFQSITVLFIDSTNIREIRGNAFEGCAKLEYIKARENHIINLENNTFSLLPNLRYLELHYNNLTRFSMELIKNNPELIQLNLNSNDLSDFDEVKLLKYAPHIFYFYFDDNEISCVRVAEIYKTLKAKGLTIYPGGFKERYYQTMKVYGLICLSDVDYAATFYRKNTDAKSGVTKIDLDPLEQSNNISVKKPNFTCTDPYGTNSCWFTNVILSEEEPEWNPVPDSSKLWNQVVFTKSSIPVFTNDICRVLSMIQILDISNLSIKEIRGNAFANCFNLYSFVAKKNHITKLDINTFSSLPKLIYLYLEENNLTSFSMELIRKNPNLIGLTLNSNDLSDIDEVKLVKYAPKLTTFSFDYNEISCVRVAEICKALKALKLLSGGYKERYYQTTKVYGHICLSDVDYAATLYRKITDAKSSATKIDLEDTFEKAISIDFGMD